MKVILIQDIKNLGKTGDIKEVTDGYARNFLLPKKLAEIATPEATKKVEKIKEEQIEREKEDLEKKQKLATELEGREIIIRAKEKKGKLFGSIGKKEIAKELAMIGFEIGEKMIEIKEPIKETGKKEIIIKLGHNIEVCIKLVIQGE